MYANYDARLIESKIQTEWEKSKTFAAKEDQNKEKFYCLSMLPYPSGQIHMGHVRNYTIGDVITRYQRMLGKNVMQPMGWDAFGLPAENAALQKGVNPSIWTYQNIKEMRITLKSLGFGIDWDREFATCTPEYYQFEQALFLRMYEKGLVYKKLSAVNWDPVDQTVLANEQVVNGRGWRSGALVERREIAQWFLKITNYADELLSSLDGLTGWPEEVRTMQRNWIGRSEGLELDFKLEKNGIEKITIFTTRPDTLFGVTYLAVAPQHPLALKAALENIELAAFIEKCQNVKVAEAELATLEKEGMYAGFNAIHPLTFEVIPVWVANFVLTEYGSGAVMAVPAHDQRDFEFAQKYHLTIKTTIKPKERQAWDFQKAAYTEDGVLDNIPSFVEKETLGAIANNVSSEEGGRQIIDYVVNKGLGKIRTHYRLRDWGVSRQRYWGAPIPMINCPVCGDVPVPLKDLPVVLPEKVCLGNDPRSPLKTMPEFFAVTCPKCGTNASRETDTFDTFMESSWYYARYCCVDETRRMFDKRTNYWLPVDQYIGGIEHAVMHLLYARFLHKVMRDFDMLQGDEPFINLLTQGMVLKDGAKMSKSKGNTVEPKALVDKYGADTVRLFIIFAAPPAHSLEWSESGVEGAYRFLRKLWNFATTYQSAFSQYAMQNLTNKPASFAFQDGPGEEIQKPSVVQKILRREIHTILHQATVDITKIQLNTVVSGAMKLLNLLQDAASTKDNLPICHEGFSILLRMLAPITPHITYYLWQELEFGEDITCATWPVVDESALETNIVEMMIQVNGKLRAKISVSKAATDEVIENLALASENVQKFVTKATLKKCIIVPNRLVNLIG